MSIKISKKGKKEYMEKVLPNYYKLKKKNNSDEMKVIMCCIFA